jgi:hypothetical protein
VRFGAWMPASSNSEEQPIQRIRRRRDAPSTNYGRMVNRGSRASNKMIEADDLAALAAAMMPSCPLQESMVGREAFAS